MTRLPKVLTSTAQIRFQHCDPFNHLNNSRFIDYFMNHREDVLIEHYDLDIFNITQTTGKSWMSRSNQIAYLRPARIMEDVFIESQLIAYDEHHLYVEMRMYDENQSHIKSLLWSSFIHVDIQKNTKFRHETKYMDLFESVVLPVSEKKFEDRMKMLIKTTKENYTSRTAV